MGGNRIGITWDEFKIRITDHIRAGKGPRMCRGHSNSAWMLQTSFHRMKSGLSFPEYFYIVSEMADIVGSLERREIDTSNADINGSFVAYLQHHGFPTPLLDWSLSPYIASFFAFQEVNDRNPESDYVTIFVFDFQLWLSHWLQTHDYNETKSHVTILKPKARGNLRQINQQGFYYIFTNVEDIEGHIRHHEIQKKCDYLQVYQISVKEKPLAMADLSSMGINAYSLFGTVDTLCKYFKDSIFAQTKVGKTPSERMADLIVSSQVVGGPKSAFTVNPS